MPAQEKILKKICPLTCDFYSLPLPSKEEGVCGVSGLSVTQRTNSRTSKLISLRVRSWWSRVQHMVKIVSELHTSAQWNVLTFTYTHTDHTYAYTHLRLHIHTPARNLWLSTREHRLRGQAGSGLTLNLLAPRSLVAMFFLIKFVCVIHKWRKFVSNTPKKSVHIFNLLSPSSLTLLPLCALLTLPLNLALKEERREDRRTNTMALSIAGYLRRKRR